MRRVIAFAAVGVLSACVTKGTHQKLQDEYNALKTENAQLKGDLTTAGSKIGDLDKNLAQTSRENTTCAQALQDLRGRQAEADRRMAEFQNLTKKFKALIDAKTLFIKIVNGRMVVAMATDVLFPSGSATLSKTGVEAVGRVGQLLSTIADRDFQVEGHTDNVPIKSSRFPSNWELASARALNVVRTLVDSGVPATKVSAASFGENRPVQDNATPEGRAANRRIEIVVVPDLSGLPGFEELSRMAQ